MCLHFFSVNWCSRQDLPTPMSPVGGSATLKVQLFTDTQTSRKQPLLLNMTAYDTKDASIHVCHFIGPMGTNWRASIRKP